MARLSNSTNNRPRERKNGSGVTGNCTRMSICDRPERGTAKCSKNRCSYYKDPKNKRNRR